MTGGNKVLAFFDEWMDPAGPEIKILLSVFFSLEIKFLTFSID